MTVIHLDNLVKRFGEFTAVRTMNLKIRDGEFLALLGPSGCGKSTTMNMIAGMEMPSEGAIRFDGRDMVDVPMIRRGVGFVFQNYAIFTHMNVYDNLAYGLKVTGVAGDEIDRRVRDMAEFLQLTPMLDKPSAKLSVNILQRLAIGRSAIVEPAIFLLDEPLSNVDASFRAVMRTELKHLQRQFEQTMVYVTHDQLEAMTMADRIAVMDHGVLQQVGTPIEVYNNPKNVFVAEFIGSPGMNIFSGRLEGKEDDILVRLEGVDDPITLPDRLKPAAKAATSADVRFGFRPEQVSLSDSGGLDLAVNFVERIGSRTIAHLGDSKNEFKCVFDNDVVLQLGETVGLEIDPDAVRLFEGDTGLAIGGN